VGGDRTDAVSNMQSLSACIVVILDLCPGMFCVASEQRKTCKSCYFDWLLSYVSGTLHVIRASPIVPTDPKASARDYQQLFKSQNSLLCSMVASTRQIHSHCLKSDNENNMCIRFIYDLKTCCHTSCRMHLRQWMRGGWSWCWCMSMNHCTQH
jgi:hypothetical protein